MPNLTKPRTFTVSGPALPTLADGEPALLLRRIRGEETLSTIYAYDLELVTALDLPDSMAANFDLKQMVGKELTVAIQLEGMGVFVAGAVGATGAANIGSGVREISGIVTEARLAAQLNRQYVYRLKLEPWIELARRRTDFRTFQNRTVVEIIDEVLKGNYLYSYVKRLNGTYPKLVWQVQYGEDDFSFIQRLMEEHGIYWFFEHSKTVHRLVLVDNLGAHKPVGSAAYQTLSYYPPGHKIDREYVSTFAPASSIQSGEWTTDDFDFTKPRANLQTRNALPQQTAHNQLTVYEWPGDYTDPQQGEQFARIRMQEIRSRGERATGEGNLRDVVCGTTFTLSGFPQDAANREYLVIRAELDAIETGEQTGSGEYAFTVKFEVQPSNVMYRPPRTIEKPRTTGPQTAIVTGAPGSEIWTNNYGMVKLSFHWDHSGVKDQNSSCWVRVSYTWAGANFGGISIPRVGTEVIVDFENGDPDRPIVVGRVYNAMTMPPWQLPANATQSGILTRSSEGGAYATANAIRFEDKKGAEQLWIQAERNMDTVVEADETHTVGHDRTKTIGHDETGSIGRHWKLQTGGYKYETVNLASVQNVGLGKMLNVGMAYNVNVGGLYLRNVALQMASTVGMDRTDRVVQNWTADVGHTYTLTVRGKAVGDAVQADQATPIDATPDFAPQLPGPVSSATSNQLQLTDRGESSLSGAKQTKLVGPGGSVTIDDAGITVEGKSITLKSSNISMTGGSAGGLAPVTEADCAECAKKTTSDHPVDVATGQKILAHDDFTLPGRMPIIWSRTYRSADQRTGSLGVAWKLPYATEVRSGTAGLTYFDADGRELQFPALEPGEEHFHRLEKYTLARGEDSVAGPTYVVRFGNSVEEHYVRHPADDTRWQLQRIANRDGHALTLHYTPQGWLHEVRNNEHTVRCVLDSAGRITTVHLGGHGQPLLADYSYDTHGDLVEAMDARGRTWRYAYDHHLLTEYRTPSGATHVSEWTGTTPQAYCRRTYAWTPSANGQRIVTRDTRFNYLPSLRVTRVTDGLGHTTEYHYNGLWAVEKTVHSDGSVTQTHFDENGSVSGQTDALGRTTRMVNDAHGNPVTVIDAAGQVTRISYNDQNLPVQITDPAGQVWQRGYDDAGHLTSETDPLGNTTAWAYENGLPVSRTDALGNVTKMQWNSAGQMLARTDCSGNTMRYSYNGLGQLTSTTDALGRVTRYQVAGFSTGNGAGQLTGYSPPGMGWWQTRYDEAGRPVTQQDPLERTTRTAWDAYDQRVAVTDAAGGNQQFAYDDIGQIRKLTNANGETTTFTYDNRGRLASQTGFDGRRQSYGYNAVGEMVERTDHGTDGQITTHIAYDVLGRPIERRASDGSQWSYRYDARGLLTQAQSSAPGQTPVQVTYEYDAAGRRTAEVQSHHGRVWRITHGLDAIGNRDWTYVPQAGALVWQRYGSGHVHGVLLANEPIANFERDALHREILRTQGPAAHHFQYADSGQLAAHRWQNLDGSGRTLEQPRAWRTWQYDKAGQLTALNDTWRGQKTYGYDPLARLASVSGPDDAREAFHYDPAGNLLGMAPSRDRIDAWHARGDRLLKFAPPSSPDRTVDFTYDGHGNRIARTVPLPPEPELTDAKRRRQHSGEAVLRTIEVLTGTPRYETAEPRPEEVRYQYDGSHQLIAIDHADGARTQYQYDALGRRVAKHHTAAGKGTATTLFVWDGDWMVQEITAGRTTHGDVPVTYVKHPDHSGPLARITASGVQHYVTDHLGTPQEIYDSQRKVLWAANLSAYGRVTKRFAGEVGNPVRFAGQYYDYESGLHYNRHRYYDPETGRYVNQDPIGLKGGMNRYAYTGGNPISFIDPMGLQHVSGQWKDCGKGCRIRIDKNASGEGRHLHWECKGKDGAMGEYGGTSHGEDYTSAPNIIKECAKKNGFKPEPEESKCPKNSSAAKAVVATGAGIGAGYIAYRIIRMIPSLFPPLWGTIPENVAIP
ncbi:type VI secretion system tip protein TssI/VgrG [Paraburkholderia lycopersici]|uniref:Type VI secretion system secreted protein VgrG n=1 Tax=Paraburkholderia lycopersici TaxID=416944 RepID=A0A1G6KV59_9BURK|nr:type VI secretion system tip protein TssI/VgrG [Paraburkholderia lycopersici]SDC34982.1 type VI secretion system secreted protein VgrG [Paraburkholderia lycopersici]